MNVEAAESSAHTAQELLVASLTRGRRAELLGRGWLGDFLLAAELMFPPLVEHRGAWFIEREGWRETADSWFATKGMSNAQIERVCSHVHLAEDNVFDESDPALAEVEAAAQVLATAWKLWAQARYGLTLKTMIEPQGAPDDVYDYVVWFESVPNG